MAKQPQIDLSAFQSEDNNFAHLSLHDLVTARDLFHVHLMRHPNVVATAIGRYRIRSTDSWPNDKKKIHGTGVRRLDNSEVRPYSWPCILAFVTEWQDPKEFASETRRCDSEHDIHARWEARSGLRHRSSEGITRTDIEVRNTRFPLNNIGPGNPIIARVQGQEYLATVGCLVSDGHKIFALTNRHVTGEAGEIVWSDLNGVRERVGVSSAKQLTRLPLTSIYPNFSVKDTYINLDVGLIEIDEISRWTTKVPGIGILGPMADFSGINLSLSLVGCHVRGVGAATGEMLGEIQGLFYRYTTGGGFEYVSDLFIGPRAAAKGARGKSKAPPKFATHPGDSGTLWVLEPDIDARASESRRRQCLPAAGPGMGAQHAGLRGQYAPAKLCAGDFAVEGLRAPRSRSGPRLEHRSAGHMGRTWPFLHRRTYACCAVRQLSAPRDADGQQQGDHHPQRRRPRTGRLQGHGDRGFRPDGGCAGFLLETRRRQAAPHAGHGRVRTTSRTWIRKMRTTTRCSA